MARMMSTETPKPIRNLYETSFAFQHSFGDRNLRKLLPKGSGGEVSPHPRCAPPPCGSSATRSTSPECPHVSRHGDFRSLMVNLIVTYE